MKLKDGFIALGIAAAMSTPAAFAQQERGQELAVPGDQEVEIPSGRSPGDTSLDSEVIEPEGSATADLESAEADEGLIGAEPDVLEEEEQQAAAEQPDANVVIVDEEEQAAVEQPVAAEDEEEIVWGDMPRDERADFAQVPPPVTEEMIRSLQVALQEAGYTPGQIDGIWGPETHQALMNYQQDTGLENTGQLTAETVTALELAEQNVQQATQQQGQQPQG